MWDMLTDSLLSGLAMIFGGNPELYLIVFVSLRCTAIACLMASCIGIPLAFCLANYEFRGRRGCILLLNTLQALPTVVVGLFLYIFISRRGILGPLDLLYTWKAITIGQFILILPLVTMFVLAALSRLDERYRLTALTLGASERQAAFAVLREARFAVVAALCAAFGRGIAEVGVSMMLGGNIKGFTRTMTTAMALEYDKGEFTLALALGIVLLAVSFILNCGLAVFQGRTGR
ncbi:MAG: ABC transporter permease [Desulfovibrio sp.]|jgi:tungstate transport system permease protein|nr:ABC transporter permease [Desulfovibrio sp.]